MRNLLLIIFCIGLYYSCSSTQKISSDPITNTEKIVVKDESTCIIIYLKKGGNDTIFWPQDSLR